MKKLFVLILVVGLLTGCAATPTFETVTDVYSPGQTAEEREVLLRLPGEAVLQAISGENGTLYLCNGYEITRQVLPSGDLNATLLAVTGYEKDRLSVMETTDGQTTRYECVWSAAGESGEIVARVAILDDGNYHYCLSAMTNAKDAGKYQDVWQKIFSSYSLG